MSDLSSRENEILKALSELATNGRTFEICVDEDHLNDGDWPADIDPPDKSEVRSLVARDLLEIDKSVAPVWRFWPSVSARELFEDDEARQRAEALTDPDARLGVILDAIVKAFADDPSTPLMIIPTGQADLIKHPDWPIEPDVVRRHDLRQLEDLDLIGWDGDNQFYPTRRGQKASIEPANFLVQTAEGIEDADEKNRLRQLAEKLRTGDLAVATVGGVTGAVIRAILGL